MNCPRSRPICCAPGRSSNRPTGNSLILLDEIGGSTSPEEGSALAIAVLEALKESGGRRPSPRVIWDR